jgi:hypothetical protein
MPDVQILTWLKANARLTDAEAQLLRAKRRLINAKEERWSVLDPVWMKSRRDESSTFYQKGWPESASVGGAFAGVPRSGARTRRSRRCSEPDRPQAAPVRARSLVGTSYDETGRCSPAGYLACCIVRDCRTVLRGGTVLSQSETLET